MPTTDVATWLGTALSGIGACVAIWQARLARSYNRRIRDDIRKLNLVRSVEYLSKALELIRKLPSDYEKSDRGRKTETLIKKIKACFDDILGTLSIRGEEEDVRTFVSSAQKALTAYEHKFNQKSLSPNMTAAIQSPVQNAMSLANERVLKIEGKA